jgi:hypothetical protein
MTRTHLAAALAVATFAAAPARAGEGRAWASGVFNVAKVEVSESRDFREFAEDGSVDVDYVFDGGPGGELGIEYRLKSGIGLQLAVAVATRDGSLAYAASFPHPLYLNRHRAASGEQGGLSMNETAVHLDLVYGKRGAKWEVVGFAGATLFNVEADVLDRPQYTHAYPYDSVTALPATAVSRSASKVGFNAGLSVDYRVSPKFGIGVQGRFSGATVELDTPPEGTLELDAGGFAVGAGLRLYF